ncbi:DNA-binding protein [Acidithiobacillus ferrivorans]|uniref:YobI family P-loop NTPase n=1 Tax=Acidithiobacillus ferrivorans TaxID=160808 RepID=UPI0002DB4993|nr:DNA-binding protein [Acidithiobacillus ferrivorans]
MSTQQEPDSGGSWNLIPLTPKYLPNEHGHYVTAIEAALANDQIHNIALSGNFGVGKSSILQEIARRQKKRVVELSLSTLVPIEATKLDESMPVQATTPTNRIQREIVKQLLYRENPGKTPASRFRRIERFQWWREIWSSALLGLAIAIIFLLNGWTAKLADTFSFLGDMGVWRHLVILGIATGMALLVRWRLYGKLQIKQLSAGSATVSLNETSVSYFDQYLDEIVYFFEVSCHDIVIFEDIDRFNDSHIFETLRALNTLLNASPQIKKPIRFIYAIKDSIFDRIGLAAEGRKLEPDMEDPAQAEVVRANRTKFFDLVIPVVPFITHRSARNLAAQLLADITHEVEPELLDLAAQYVPDMRLLKNVRNEFLIFRDRIFSGDGKQLNLSETDLFAMMLYKSTHLTDFETIRLGNSKLDVLYEVSRELVTANIKKLEGELRDLRKRLPRIDGVATRSAQLGERLLAHMDRTARAAQLPMQNTPFIFANGQRSREDLKGAQFWKDFITSGGNPVLTCRTNQGRDLIFTRDDLAAALGDPLDAENWDKAAREALNEQIKEKTDDIKFLRGADLDDLVRGFKFLVKYEGTDQSFEAIAQAILKPGLAYQLVRAGYINRNFTLYTSTFHGDRVGSAATNFIIHHVERDLMDEYFVLDSNDVDAIVRERGKNALKEPALYNIAILDRLLTSNDEAADIMVRSLVSFGENQTRFMQAYLTAGKQRLKFIERFTLVTSQVLTYLVSQADLEDNSRLDLIDVALTHLSLLEQKVDAAVSEYLSAHYAEFRALTSATTEQAQAERIGALFASANITISRLGPLTAKVRSAFVSLNLYEVTHENLSIAIDNTETVALDVISATNKTVYDYALRHLITYLGAITGESATVHANNDFISVIEDVLGQEAPLLGDVVERAAPDCKVADIAGVSDGAWPALAEHGRFPATFGNVSRYVMTLESVDEHLAKVLTAAGEITEINAADKELKTKLAIAILAAKNQLPSAALRTELVASLSLENYLDVDDVEAEVGELFALLMKHDIIEDTAGTYEHLAGTDWLTRKAFICASKKFSSYMTPELLRPDLAALLTSDEINAEIKDLIVAQAEAYAEVADPSGLNELAQYAIRHGQNLAPDVVQKMAHTGVNTQQVVVLLEPHMTSISREQLFTILQELDGDYSSLTEVGQDKPEIPNTDANLALLQRLKQEGIVDKYDEHESPIKVNKRDTP